MEHHNKNCVLILGSPSSGKTASLRNLPLEETLYINTDGKPLPFKGKNRVYKFVTPQDPLEVISGVMALESDEKIKYVVIDTLSFWLNSIEKQHVIFSKDSRGAWGEIYAYNIDKLLHFANNVSTKSWIFISHTQESDKTVNFVTQTKCYAKGSIGKMGVEAWFTNVVYSDKYIDKGEVKYRFQVALTEQSVGLSIRSPMGMWDSPFTASNDVMELFATYNKYEEE
jgi:hypothetical protein